MFFPRFGVEAPGGHEQRGDQGADDEAVEAEQGQAAEGGDEDHVVRQLGVLAHQDRAQHVVRQADHDGAEGGQYRSLPDGPGGQEVDCHRPPDQAGTDGWQQRQHRHQYAPEHRTLQIQHPEDEATQRALNGCHGDIALDRGLDHGGELAQQVLLVDLPQRNGPAHRRRHLTTIAQQEEQQVQHDGEADQELEGVLADAEGLGRQILTAGHGELGNPLLHPGQVGQAEALKQLPGKTRQGVDHLLYIAAEIHAAAAQALVDIRPLLHQRTGQQAHRQDDDQQDDDQGNRSSPAAALIQTRFEAPLHRLEDDRQNGAPEYRTVEGQQDSHEGHRHQSQQQQEALVFQIGIDHDVLFRPAAGRGQS